MSQRSLMQYVIVSVVLHLGILGVLSISMEFIPRPQPQAQVVPIQATAIDSQAVQRKVAELKRAQQQKRDAERRRVAELERKLQAAEKKRVAEENRIKKLQQERKRKEVEKRKADEAAKQARLKQQQEQQKARKAEEARKRKEQERRKAEKAAQEAKQKRLAEEAKRKAAEEQRKRAAEAEKKRKAEAKRKAEEAARKKREQQELEAMMQAEMDALAEEGAEIHKARQQRVLSERDKYIALIRATITRNWTVDAAMQGKSCTLVISLARDGFVTSVSKGKGNPVVCQSARTAVLKAQTLPVSQDPEVYEQMKKISLIMEPSF